MSSLDITNVISQSVIGLLLLALIVFSLTKCKKCLLLYSLILLQLDILFWTLFGIMQVFTIDKPGFVLFSYLKYLSICYSGFLFMIFSYIYTTKNTKNLKHIIMILGIPPTLCYIGVLTNELHHLFFIELKFYGLTKYGVLFIIETIISYLYTLVGCILLIIHMVNQPKPMRKQVLFILIAFFCPFIINVMMVCGIINFHKIDLTIVCFALTMMFLTIAIWKYKLLNIIPIALEEITQNMHESILVIDSFNNIVYTNKSLLLNFCYNKKSLINEPITNFVSELRNNIVCNEFSTTILDAMESGTTEYLYGEFQIMEPEQRYYFAYAKPIYNLKNKLIGRVFSFNDVSGYRQLVEKLALFKERDRIAVEMHDNLGRTLTLLGANLELGLYEMENAKTNFPSTSKHKFVESLNLSKEGLRQLRSFVSGITNIQVDKQKAKNLVESLNNLFSKYKDLGIKIDFSCNINNLSNSSIYDAFIYKICQESITNSIRHGKAKQVKISLNFDINVIKLNIFDNGEGCTKIKKNFGLSRIMEYVSGVNGKIQLSSKKDEGFKIDIELPNNVDLPESEEVLKSYNEVIF